MFYFLFNNQRLKKILIDKIESLQNLIISDNIYIEAQRKGEK